MLNPTVQSCAQKDAHAYSLQGTQVQPHSFLQARCLAAVRASDKCQRPLGRVLGTRHEMLMSGSASRV